MGISVKVTPTELPKAEEAPTEALPPIGDEELRVCWEAMAEAMKGELPKLSEQLKEKELRLEGENFFVILVNNSYLDAEIRPHLIRMLTYLRKRSGRPDLNCRVEVVYEEREAVAYSPRDKYEVMSQANPALEEFRIIFPEVDY